MSGGSPRPQPSLVSLYGKIDHLTRRLAELETVRHSSASRSHTYTTRSLYRVLVDQSLGLMCVHDLQGELLFVNPAAAHSLGYAPADGVGRNLQDFLSIEVRAAFPEYLARIRQKGLDSGKLCLIAKDGSERLWSYRNVLAYSPDGRPCVFGHAQDVTEQTRLIHALRASEAHYRSVAENAPSLLWATDACGGLVFASNRLIECLGQRWPELAGNGWLDCVHPEDRISCQAVFQQTSAARGALDLVFRARQAGGDYLWLHAQGEPRPDPAAGLEGVIRIIEEPRSVQPSPETESGAAIASHVQQAEKLEAIGVLAGGIAHDFNNLLTAISGNLELARSLAGQSASPYLERAAGATERAVTLASQLLTFAKGGNPTRRRCSAGTILRQAVAQLRKPDEVNLIEQIQPGLPDVDADPVQLMQAYGNLLENAAQSTRPGGAVLLRAARHVETGESSAAPGTYVRVEIRDFGPGVEPAELSRIFDPYYATRKPGGGLGLAAAYSIVTKHGGFLTAFAEPDGGMRIVCDLPSCEAEGTSAGKPAPEAVKRALVMDDEPMLIELAAMALRGMGYEVEGAANGEEAIQRFSHAIESGRPFQAVLLDLTIPFGMGGAAAIKILRSLDSRFRAIVTSGYSDDPVMANPDEYGFDAVLPKPWKISQLKRALTGAAEAGA